MVETTHDGKRRFHLLALVGRGAYGDVFLAELDTGDFRRRVALKVLNAKASELVFARDRLRDEAKILGRLEHRSIVSALDLARVDGRLAIVMEWIAGADLDQIVRALTQVGESFPGCAAMEAGAAISSALHAAHSAGRGEEGRPVGVVHRDVKPSNVRVTSEGDVKVLDFGVALVLEGPVASPPIRLGTPRYMAPARLSGLPESPAGDVYGIAVTIVELLLGRPLGQAPRDEDSHAAFVGDALARVRFALRGPSHEVDAALETLGSALASSPGLRPTAGELASRFEHHARKLGGADLRTFSRRFVPTVDGLIGPVATPVSGVLSDSSFLAASGGLSYSPPAPVHYTPTIREESSPWLVLVGLGASFLTLAAVLALGVALSLPTALGAMELSPPVPVAMAEPTTGLDELPAPVQEPVRPRKVAESLDIVPEVPVVEPARLEVVEPALVPVPLVDRALFWLPGASGLVVQCGEVSREGTSSVRMTRFPRGPCRVEGRVFGQSVDSVVSVDRIARVTCQVAEGAMSCAMDGSDP